ncbi:MAG TPA: tetratricopeptide repeat protein [Woeseiaceae bacterium]|nr:tetratricopeptide repeat protein [Woeseiaceae bacterium]
MKKAISPIRRRGAALALAALLACRTAAAAEPAAADRSEQAAEAEQRGFDLLLGQGVPADPAAASGWFEKAAAAGRPVAQLQLGLLYWDGNGVAEDAGRALRLFQQAAAQGLPSAQARVGWAYLTGTGVSVDFGTAHEWLAAAAHQGEPWALYLLAYLYRDGRGVPQDAGFADALDQRAMELHFGPAEVDVALSWLYGPLDRRDSARGIHLLRQAAARNNPDAAFVLAQQYLRGRHVARDPGVAFEWFSRAADGGHRLAALWQAELIARGLGVERNESLAREKREAALAAATVVEKNDFAWMLSVNPDPALRNGELAVAIMEAVLADPASRTPAHVDTLAAAYAEMREFGKAVAAQQEAIDALPADAGPELVAGFEERLQLYLAGKPYRSTP